jgi:hypothetical protein
MSQSRAIQAEGFDVGRAELPADKMQRRAQTEQKSIMQHLVLTDVQQAYLRILAARTQENSHHDATRFAIKL